MERTDSIDIKSYYTITKERKSQANAELERHLLLKLFRNKRFIPEENYYVPE